MRFRELFGLGLAASAMLACWLGPRVLADEPPQKPAPAPPPALAYDAARTQAEREANEVGYREHVAGMRNRLLNDHLGAWVVMAKGKAFPVNEHGTMVRPAATMGEAVAAATKAAPDAAHRFVFRIGEEGEWQEPLGGAELPHVLGVWFLMQFERPDIEMRGYGPNQPIHFVKNGVRTEITAKGPDHRMFVRPELGPPGGAGRADALYGLSTGFGGYGVMAAETAAAASLHLWEIPGHITVDGVFQKGTCRRARARFVFKGTDLDFLLPVAIWPAKS
jgi:hypothetical protein